MPLPCAFSNTVASLVSNKAPLEPSCIEMYCGIPVLVMVVPELESFWIAANGTWPIPGIGSLPCGPCLRPCWRYVIP
jgi:hypothetical protein